jgi:hypothetical protein
MDAGQSDGRKPASVDHDEAADGSVDGRLLAAARAWRQ